MKNAPSSTSLSAYAALAERCADAARLALLPHFRQRLDVISKNDDSPVTIADRAAERVMRRILEENAPTHAILGEEDGRSGAADEEWLWVLDPIDGTRAFVTGRPSFCMLLSLFHRGRPVLGVIDQPVTGERWIGLNGVPTRYVSALPGRPRTRENISLENAELSCTAPDIIRPARRPAFDRLARKAKRVSWGGDAYAYGLLALGQIDVIAEDTLKPWDWGALVPVIEGAGGSLTDWAGHPLGLDSDGSVLACGNARLAEEAVATLR